MGDLILQVINKKFLVMVPLVVEFQFQFFTLNLWFD